MTDVVEQWSDPRWRLRNLYWVVDKDGSKVRFRPNADQERFLGALHSRNIILKCRQRGFTTLGVLIQLDAALFTPNINCAFIAHKMDDAKAIFQEKAKFAYDNLPDALKLRIPLVKDSADTLHLANGSSVVVTTSARSGTFQYMHISEFGKICALYPAKAREIITGSLPAVPNNGFLVIESTAEGSEGRFYDMCRVSMGMQEAGRKLSLLDWKFHFFPWWRAEEYRLDGVKAGTSPEDERYFEKMCRDVRRAAAEYRAAGVGYGWPVGHDGLVLSEAQKAWWLKMEATLGGDMKREYPATPEEAFEQAIDGAIFEHQIAHAMRHGHIGRYAVDPRFPVNTYWDLGRNDANAIWLHQYVRGRNRFVGYYENSGEYIGHYVKWLAEWARANEVMFGEHVLPFDGNRQDLFLEDGRAAVMEGMGFRPRFGKRVRNKWDAIEAARSVFIECDFDEDSCKDGLKRLRTYRKEWDDQRGVWKNMPAHDEASHGADAFLTFATARGAMGSGTGWGDGDDDESGGMPGRQRDYGRSMVTGY